MVAHLLGLVNPYSHPFTLVAGHPLHLPTPSRLQGKRRSPLGCEPVPLQVVVSSPHHHSGPRIISGPACKLQEEQIHGGLPTTDILGQKRLGTCPSRLVWHPHLLASNQPPDAMTPSWSADTQEEGCFGALQAQKTCS